MPEKTAKPNGKRKLARNIQSCRASSVAVVNSATVRAHQRPKPRMAATNDASRSSFQRIAETESSLKIGGNYGRQNSIDFQTRSDVLHNFSLRHRSYHGN